MKTKIIKTKILYLIFFISITMITSFYYIGFRDSTVDSFFREKHSRYNVLVDSLENRMYLIEASSGKVIKEYTILTSKTLDPSLFGTWSVENKTDIQGGFGTPWIELGNGSKKYSIHGISNLSYIENLDSHNCILMNNMDIVDLYKFLEPNTIVIFSGNENINFQ